MAFSVIKTCATHTAHHGRNLNTFRHSAQTTASIHDRSTSFKVGRLPKDNEKLDLEYKSWRRSCPVNVFSVANDRVG